MFCVCEILPIFVLLDYSYLALVGLQRVEIRQEDEDEGSIGTQSTLNEPITTAPSSARSVRWRDDALVEPLLRPAQPIQESDSYRDEDR